jgi:hypothetical protein
MQASLSDVRPQFNPDPGAVRIKNFARLSIFSMSVGRAQLDTATGAPDSVPAFRLRFPPSADADWESGAPPHIGPLVAVSSCAPGGRKACQKLDLPHEKLKQ